MLVLKEKQGNKFKIFDTITKEVELCDGNAIHNYVKNHVEIFGIVPTQHFENFVIDKCFKKTMAANAYDDIHTTIWWSSRHNIYVLQCPDMSLRIIDGKGNLYSLRLYTLKEAIVVFDEKYIKVYSKGVLPGVFEVTQLSINKEDFGEVVYTKHYSCSGYERIDEHINKYNQEYLSQVVKDTFNRYKIQNLDELGFNYKFIESYRTLNDKDYSLFILEDTKYNFRWVYDGWKVDRPYKYDIYRLNALNDKQLHLKLKDIYKNVIDNIIEGYIFEDDIVSDKSRTQFFTTIVNIETGKLQRDIVKQYNISDIFAEVQLSYLGFFKVFIRYSGFVTDTSQDICEFHVNVTDLK